MGVVALCHAMRKHEARSRHDKLQILRLISPSAFPVPRQSELSQIRVGAGLKSFHIIY